MILHKLIHSNNQRQSTENLEDREEQARETWRFIMFYIRIPCKDTKASFEQYTLSACHNSTGVF